MCGRRWALAACSISLLVAGATSRADEDNRVHVGVGYSPFSYASYGVDGYHRTKGESFLELGGGYSRRVFSHLELGAGLQLASLTGTSVRLVRVPLSVRGFLSTDLDRGRTGGLEVGGSLRLGPLFGTATDTTFAGGFIGVGIDVRLMVSQVVGAFIGADAWWARASTSTDHPAYSDSLFALSLPTVNGGVLFRF